MYNASWGMERLAAPGPPRKVSFSSDDGKQLAAGGGALGAGGGVALEAGGVPPGGDEKQEIEAGVGWSLSGTSVVEVEEFDDEVGGVCGGKDLDEEAGVAVKNSSVEVGSGMKLKKGEEEDVLEVLLDAGDALTAKEALLQVCLKVAVGIVLKKKILV